MMPSQFETQADAMLCDGLSRQEEDDDDDFWFVCSYKRATYDTFAPAEEFVDCHALNVSNDFKKSS